MVLRFTKLYFLLIFLTFFSNGSKGSEPDNGDFDTLVGHWRLDEGSGILASDSSSSLAHATLSSPDNNHWQRGVENSALCLSGSDEQQIRVDIVPAELQPASVTLSAWVRTDQSQSGWSWIASQGVNYGLALNPFNRDGIMFVYYNGSTWDYVSAEDTVIRDGNWHHVAGSYDQETGTLAVYLDGESLASFYRPNGIVYSQGDGFNIGSMPGSPSFSGCIDEVQVYTRALDDEEVLDLSTEHDPIVPENKAPELLVTSEHQELFTGESAELTITVKDDMLPENSNLTITIDQVEGPSSAIYDSPAGNDSDILYSSIVFQEAGYYTFRIIADDGSLNTTQDISFTVSDEPIIPGPYLEGVKALWHLDETEGTRVLDSSGNRQSGSLEGLQEDARSEGVFNSSVCFSGKKNHHIAINTVAEELQASSVSVTAWVKVNPDLKTWAWVAAQGNNYGLIVNRFSNDDLLFYIYNGLTWESAGMNYVGLLDGEWHHIVGSFDDSTNKISLYMDGILVKQKRVNRQIAYRIGNGFTIGSMLGKRVFDGCIDEVQVYDRALTGEEVLQLLQ